MNDILTAIANWFATPEGSELLGNLVVIGLFVAISGTVMLATDLYGRAAGLPPSVDSPSRRRRSKARRRRQVTSTPYWNL